MEARLAEGIRTRVPLAGYTTWRIGGAAEYFAEPADCSQLSSLLAWARRRQLAVTLLGRGSNVLVADAGIGGLVISMRGFRATDLEVNASGGMLTAGAGVSLPRLAKAAAAAGYGGYEFFIGIPGSVGGAVVMNAGFGPGDERQTANRCVAVELMDRSGCRNWVPYADLHPDYRYSDLQARDDLVVAARFTLSQRADKEQIRAETARHLAMRKATQPLTRPTAGSVFAACAGTPAAIYIDQCGLKGERCGGAVISPKHANWIENLGGATAADVEALIALIKQRVHAAHGVRLHEEVRRLGGSWEA
jgi:UDP-N-acetylmuramate dehydrogenase